MYELLTAVGGACLATWLALLFTKRKKPPDEEIRALTLKAYGEGNLPAELSPAQLQRQLTRYASDQSALQVYVRGLRDRFEASVGIKVIQKRIEEAHVKKELRDTVIELLQSEGRLRRLPDEEALKDTQVETQQLEEREKQEEIRWRLKRGGELREAEHEYKLRKLRKETADLDKEPEKTTRPKPPSKEEALASRLAAQKKLREQIQAQEQEELLRFRLEKRPDPAKDREVYEDEAVWLADWREVDGDQADFVLGEYENIKSRYRKMLNDALEELG